ncbi:MAG: hypothetical protein FWF75_07590 [Propionibacteriaceae bacterium]|nr:hypothetical protein [Propionibacteriaceae bacterium]
MRNGSVIGGARSAAYTLSSADAGKKISVRLGYTRSGYYGTMGTSAAVTVDRFLACQKTPTGGTATDKLICDLAITMKDNKTAHVEFTLRANLSAQSPVYLTILAIKGVAPGRGDILAKRTVTSGYAGQRISLDAPLAQAVTAQMFAPGLYIRAVAYTAGANDQQDQVLVITVKNPEVSTQTVTPQQQIEQTVLVAAPSVLLTAAGMVLLVFPPTGLVIGATLALGGVGVVLAVVSANNSQCGISAGDRLTMIYRYDADPTGTKIRVTVTTQVVSANGYCSLSGFTDIG